MIEDYPFDPAICGWDRPGGVYHDDLRIFKKDKQGNFQWCRRATPAETLWIFEFEQKAKAGQPNWSEPRPLQIDSYATGRELAHASVFDGKVRLEVTNGGDSWVAEFPAPWATPAGVMGRDGQEDTSR